MSIIGRFFGLIDRYANVGDKTCPRLNKSAPRLQLVLATDPKATRLLEVFDKGQRAT
jgi:hypothetical protein